VYPSEVVGLDVPNGRLRAVKTSSGDIEADVLVVACGVDTPKVAAMAGLTVPLMRSPGVLFHSEPQPMAIDRVLLTPIGNVKQKPDGRIVTGLDFGPSSNEHPTKEDGTAFFKMMSSIVPALAAAPVEKVTVGYRPLPKDSYPIVGFPQGRRDIYVTVMHSGITLGPLVGRLAAMEILDDVRVEPLAPYRLERFKS
jgi:glycine/D-amino acid oxidase-like deaminating enzyme